MLSGGRIRLPAARASALPTPPAHWLHEGRRDLSLTAESDRMSWWSRLTSGNSKRDSKPQRIDYLSEALALERQGDFDAALTSYRLALRDHPNDPKILQNMAIAFSKTGRLEEAIRSYRRALELDPELAGSHYGLAFLLLKRGDQMGAARHLEAFLAQPPSGADAARWVRHARDTLDTIQASADSPTREVE